MIACCFCCSDFPCSRKCSAFILACILPRSLITRNIWSMVSKRVGHHQKPITTMTCNWNRNSELIQALYDFVTAARGSCSRYWFNHCSQDQCFQILWKFIQLFILIIWYIYLQQITLCYLHFFPNVANLFIISLNLNFEFKLTQIK